MATLAALKPRVGPFNPIGEPAMKAMPCSRFLCAGAASLAFSIPSSATTIHVPDDQPTIATALAAAASGDSVVVACGTYLENNLVMASGATLRSATGDPACVIIDAASSGAILDCSDVAPETRIEGITFKSGSAAFGGGIACLRSSPAISDCIFESCIAEGAGGAIGLDEASPTISRCTFQSNESLFSAGGAIFAEDNSSFVLNDCVFDDNSADVDGGAIYAENSSNFSATGCRFIRSVGAGGGAISITEASPTLTNCVFSRNAAVEGSAILFTAPADEPFLLTLEGCSFSRNEAPFGTGAIEMNEAGNLTMSKSIIAGGINIAAITCSNPASVISITCSNVHGNADGDWVGCIESFHSINENFSLDPLFCDAAQDDLTIRSDSPCVNHGGCGLVGALDVGCKPDAVEATSWGAIKARYR